MKLNVKDLKDLELIVTKLSTVRCDLEGVLFKVPTAINGANKELVDHALAMLEVVERSADRIMLGSNR